MARLRRALLLPSLLARFAAVSAIAVLCLGSVLFHVLDSSIRSRALASARESAVLTARAVVAPHISSAELQQGLTPTQLSDLDREVGQGLTSAGITRIKLWNLDGRVVYSDDRALV